MDNGLMPGGTPPAPDTGAPAVPEVRVAPEVPAVTPSAEDAAAAADDAEWGDAAKEIFPGITKLNKEEAKKDEQPDATTTTTTTIAPETTTTTTTTLDPNETPEQKAEREAAELETAKKEDEEPDTTARDTRLAAREAQRQVELVATDVRKQMYADAPTELKDADGDPIKSIDDVMKLMNPRTGEAFTEAEAGTWLLAAQQKFNQDIAAQDKEIERIAEVNVDLKDQADVITYKYGELLKADTALRDRIWAQYEKTLVKDPKTNIVTRMPVSLEEFYEVALAPYAKLAETAEDTQAKATAEAARIAAEAETKAKKRADRSDIFGGKTDITDDEDKEWNEAAVAVFGPLKPKGDK